MEERESKLPPHSAGMKLPAVEPTTIPSQINLFESMCRKVINIIIPPICYTIVMETALILAQTIYYFVVSAAILALGILFTMLVYRLVQIAKELQQISEHFHEASADAVERVNDILDNLSELPFLSFFLKKRKRADMHDKGR